LKLKSRRSSAWWSSGLAKSEAEAVNPLVDGSSPSGGANPNFPYYATSKNQS